MRLERVVDHVAESPLDLAEQEKGLGKRDECLAEISSRDNALERPVSADHEHESPLRDPRNTGNQVVTRLHALGAYRGVRQREIGTSQRGKRHRLPTHRPDQMTRAR